MAPAWVGGRMKRHEVHMHWMHVASCSQEEKETFWSCFSWWTKHTLADTHCQLRTYRMCCIQSATSQERRSAWITYTDCYSITRSFSLCDSRAGTRKEILKDSATLLLHDIHLKTIWNTLFLRTRRAKKTCCLSNTCSNRRVPHYSGINHPVEEWLLYRRLVITLDPFLERQLNRSSMIWDLWMGCFSYEILLPLTPSSHSVTIKGKSKNFFLFSFPASVVSLSRGPHFLTT